MEAVERAPEASALAYARHLSAVRERSGPNATLNDVKAVGNDHLPKNAIFMLTRELASDPRNIDLSEPLDWNQVGRFCWTDRADISDAFMQVLTNVHPEGQQIRQALAEGVAASKLALLYSSDIVGLAEGIRARLRHTNMNQFNELLGALQGSRIVADHFWPTLLAERQRMPEQATSANQRLNPIVQQATNGTYAREIFRLHEVLLTLLAWSEHHFALEPWQQVSHVWLIKRLLATPLLGSR